MQFVLVVVCPFADPVFFDPLIVHHPYHSRLDYYFGLDFVVAVIAEAEILLIHN